MLVCDRKLLEDEINRVYTEHYSSCNTKAVHDFYRAVIRRVRRYTVWEKPEIISAKVTRARFFERKLFLTVYFRMYGRKFGLSLALPDRIYDLNCRYMEVTK